MDVMRSRPETLIWLLRFENLAVCFIFIYVVYLLIYETEIVSERRQREQKMLQGHLP
jgi:hypothetical protein